MNLSIALFFLVNAIFISAKSLPNEFNPCKQEGLYALKYYYPYPNDNTFYIECDPWGQMHVKECPENTKWNTWISSCITQVPEHELPKVVTYNKTQSCSFYGNLTCQNGGYCNELKCLCLNNFTGIYCEHASDSFGAFGQLVTDTFSLDMYKSQRPLLNNLLLLNATNETSRNMDELTKKRVQEYLNKYPRGEMRFDVLINYLTQDFLNELYPSAFFLREFLLESEIAVGYSSAIPNILQSAKYSFDNFNNFFKIFDQVLDNLVVYLNKGVPSVRSEAKAFLEIYNAYYGVSSNRSISKMASNLTNLTRSDLRQSIYNDFNATLNRSFEMFKCLNKFDDELSVNGVKYTSDQMNEAIGKFTLDLNELLSEVNLISASIWDSMSFYGFWHVTSVIAHPKDGLHQMLPFVVNDNMWIMLNEYSMSSQNALNNQKLSKVQRETLPAVPEKDSYYNEFELPHQVPMFNLMPSIGIGR